MSFTVHATIRAQQRALPPIAIELLREFGEEVYDGRGGIRRYFSKRSRRRLERAWGCAPVRLFSKYLNAYIVESSHDGHILTAAHRTKRAKN